MFDSDTSNYETALYTAVKICFILIAMIHTVRPHPIFLRLVLALSMLYELILIFVLFQDKDDVRKLLAYIDPDLGVPIEEKDYSSNCQIYDPEMPNDPYHNVWHNTDWYVITHLFGWWAKAIIFRDYWTTFIVSIIFEFLEYSLEHQLPVLGECWWDKWIVDAVICNGLGIWLGMKTLHVLEGKLYDWSLWSIPANHDKFQQDLSQFNPNSWTKFYWCYTENFRRWFVLVGPCMASIVWQINSFYIMAEFWIPLLHVLNFLRASLMLFIAAVYTREEQEYLSSPLYKRFGQQSWVAACILVTECMVVFTFGYERISKPFPPHVIVLWVTFFTIFLSWSFWSFRLPRKCKTASGREVNESIDENNTRCNRDN